MGKMTGKVALISGGAEGIGGTVAALFVAEGGSVMLGDLQLDKAKAHAATLGPNADAVQLDVRDLGQWEAAVAATLARFGKLTTLCNIAGISEPGNTVDVDLDSWHRHIDINLTGSFYGCRAALPALAASDEPATIVNIGSMLAHRAAGGMAAYCASKAGVTHLTKTVALDCAERGLKIRANTVHPGAIRTPMYNRYLNAGGATPEQIEAVMASAHPMGRVGEPDEVARAILFLSCEDSSFTSGTDLNVDGASAIRS
ncbi:SDR family oxidoreductase [Novosphingobium sp.]|uniref:SDR family NAD(P)-dependent oxidoreductase n=1 Tax=Novosphingobium sp. TaxID=1874826 RepID=UPI00262401F1|nr:SDR family oxidoreductase [Novosphingobium sp.]